MNFGRRSDWLANLERDQFPNDKIPAHQRDRECGDRGGDRAERHIGEDVQAGDFFAEAMEEVHHRALLVAGCRWLNSSMTRSVRAARLPLTRTRSPADEISARSSAAAAGVSTFATFPRPAALAASEIPAATSPIVMS